MNSHPPSMRRRSAAVVLAVKQCPHSHLTLTAVQNSQRPNNRSVIPAANAVAYKRIHACAIRRRILRCLIAHTSSYSTTALPSAAFPPHLITRSIFLRHSFFSVCGFACFALLQLLSDPQMGGVIRLLTPVELGGRQSRHSRQTCCRLEWSDIT